MTDGDTPGEASREELPGDLEIDAEAASEVAGGKKLGHGKHGVDGPGTQTEDEVYIG